MFNPYDTPLDVTLSECFHTLLFECKYIRKLREQARARWSETHSDYWRERFNRYADEYVQINAQMNLISAAVTIRLDASQLLRQHNLYTAQKYS